MQHQEVQSKSVQWLRVITKKNGRVQICLTQHKIELSMFEIFQQQRIQEVESELKEKLEK